jgi:integrase
VTSRAFEKALDALGEPGRRHGFRSSFRTWVQDTGAMGQDVAATALAQRIGGQVERSYAHSSLLEQRRETMAKWAAFVTGEA